MNRKIEQPKKLLKEKVYILLSILVVPVIVFLVYNSLRSQRLKDIEFIKKDFVETQGIVIKKSAYKGHSITVKYKVENKFYEESDGFNENDKVEEGDSISIKYSKTKPELMITIFNDDF